MTYHLQFGALLPYWHVLLQGLIFTIVLTAVSTVAGVAVGTAGASARTFGPVWLGRVVVVYVELIRNTPFIVQLFFIYFGLPAPGLKLTESVAAVLAMTVNLGAYSTEIIRAGIEAVPKRHIEAGGSLAMSKWEVLRHVVLKQAFRKIYPALSSRVIIVMLGSAVVSQISTPDLIYQASFIQSRTFRAFEIYLVAAECTSRVPPGTCLRPRRRWNCSSSSVRSPRTGPPQCHCCSAKRRPAWGCMTPLAFPATMWLTCRHIFPSPDKGSV